jgi:lipopolysaccharide/colanic/teichoic acid biosynthesis glycosyltransferase
MPVEIETPINSVTRLPVLQSWRLETMDAESRAHEPGIGYDVATRILDIVISMLALTLFAPLMILIAIVIKFTSRGAVIFRQVRIGCDRRKRGASGARAERRNDDVFGKPFVLYKFRSMHGDARERFPELYAYQHSEEEMRTLPIKILVGQKCNVGELNGQLNSRLLSDPRVTPFGRWLRRTSFDELPNFFNVLKGDMHLVGPRPDIAENIRYYSERHMRKLDVKPGITGLAQVSGRGKLSFDMTNEYDVLYVANRSVLFDLKIIFRTLLVCVKRDGAF